VDEMHEICLRHWQTSSAYRILTGETEGRNPFGKLSVDGRIILK
jgi:hypothetical protein